MLSKLILLFFVSSSLIAATYEDFIQFVEKEVPTFRDESVWKELYDTFLKGLCSENKPFLFAIGGGPASGKTTFRRQCTHFSNMHIHDMDEVVIRLAEYKKDCAQLGPRAAFQNWFVKAREIADAMVQFALANRYSILYDRTCAAERTYFDLLQASKLGYRVSLIGLSLDVPTALKRAAKREQEEGRCLTESLIKEWHARFSAIWPYYLAFVKEISLYDTSKELPKLIYSSTSGVQDPVLYENFLKRGELFKDHYHKHLSPFHNDP